MLARPLAVAVLLAPAAAAADAPQPRKGVLSVVLENDLFAEQSPDRHYSNGVQIAYLWGPDREPGWARAAADLFPPFADKVDVRFEVSAGQKMFTPVDLSAPIPRPGERPYAGLAYATFGMVTESDERNLDQLQFLVGVVGPPSPLVQRLAPAAVLPLGGTRADQGGPASTRAPARRSQGGDLSPVGSKAGTDAAAVQGPGIRAALRLHSLGRPRQQPELTRRRRLRSPGIG